mgnify:CR=1 FL=1
MKPDLKMTTWFREGFANLEIQALQVGRTIPGNRAGHPDTWTEDEEFEGEPTYAVILDCVMVANGSEEMIYAQLPGIIDRLMEAALDAVRDASSMPNDDENDGEPPIGPDDLAGEILA